MHYIQGTNRSEIKLFPEIENWISKDNPIRLLDLIIDKLILSNPDKFKWKGVSNTGRKSYSPATMLKLFLYGYLNRIASSRRLEIETYRNIELMWLLGELHPDHWTISEYRKNNREHIRFVTIEFRKFLKAEGYITGKVVVTDGSKFKAYASRDMLSLSSIEKRLKKINKKLDEYLEEFKKTDTIEDLVEEFGGDLEGAEVNTALIEKIESLQKQLSRLESQKAQLEKSGKNYFSPNDPDATLMKSREGIIPCYNGQIVVDKEHRMIATAEVTTEPVDINELKNNVNDLKQQLDIEPEIIEADKGYINIKQIKEIEEETDTKCYIPLQESARKNKDEEAGIKFKYDKEKDEYQCSQGRRLKLKQKKKHRGHFYNVYQCINNDDCLVKEKCTKSKNGRRIHRNVMQEWINNYHRRMQKKTSRERVMERKTIAEHPFGTLKWMMGKFHFLLTGKEKVQIELDLYTTAYNFKRLINTDNMELLLQKAEKYHWKGV